MEDSFEDISTDEINESKSSDSLKIDRHSSRFKCIVCNLRVLSLSNLHNHQAVHHSSEELSLSIISLQSHIYHKLYFEQSFTNNENERCHFHPLCSQSFLDGSEGTNSNREPLLSQNQNKNKTTTDKVPIDDPEIEVIEIKSNIRMEEEFQDSKLSRYGQTIITLDSNKTERKENVPFSTFSHTPHISVRIVQENNATGDQSLPKSIQDSQIPEKNIFTSQTNELDDEGFIRSANGLCHDLIKSKEAPMNEGCEDFTEKNDALAIEKEHLDNLKKKFEDFVFLNSINALCGDLKEADNYTKIERKRSITDCKFPSTNRDPAKKPRRKSTSVKKTTKVKKVAGSRKKKTLKPSKKTGSKQ